MLRAENAVRLPVGETQVGKKWGIALVFVSDFILMSELNFDLEHLCSESYLS